MQEATTKGIYDFMSSIYDKTFSPLVKRRIQTAIGHMVIGQNDWVLDMGIGTGSSLSFFPSDRGNIVGIDLSGGMLDHCRRRIKEKNLDRVTVFQADALHLPFADNTFDHVFISHVISVVSDPYRLVREAQRVSKPDSRIVIVNHFQSTNRFIALVEKMLCPLCTRIGWRSDLMLQDIVSRTGMQIDYRYKLDSIDLWETVVMTNNKSSLQKPQGDYPRRMAV